MGSSIDLSTRFNYHIKGLKSNILLQRAINKYNLQDFYFIIFEYCKPEELLSREQFYLDEIKPEFYILKIAGSLLGYKHSKNTKLKISKALIGDNHPKGMLGKFHSIETIEKIRKAIRNYQIDN